MESGGICDAHVGVGRADDAVPRRRRMRITPAARIVATSRCRCSGRTPAGSVGSNRSRGVAIGMSPCGRCPRRPSLRDRCVVWRMRASAACYWLLTRGVNRMVRVSRSADEPAWSAILTLFRSAIPVPIPHFGAGSWGGKILRGPTSQVWPRDYNGRFGPAGRPSQGGHANLGDPKHRGRRRVGVPRG